MKKGIGGIETAMDRQKFMSTSDERFLPQNLPDGHFKTVLASAWSLAIPNKEPDIHALAEYIEQAAHARYRFDPTLPTNQFLAMLNELGADEDSWMGALSWTTEAITAEWAYREGFIGRNRFDMENFDFVSGQVWGTPLVPGAVARAASPGNRAVEVLAKAMDAVFNEVEVGCAVCHESALYKELAMIDEAISAADTEAGSNVDDDFKNEWRISGAIAALGLSPYYTDGSEEHREHCYHVVHGAVNTAQHLFVRDQMVRECGEWCEIHTVLPQSFRWARAFSRAIEAGAAKLIADGHIEKEGVGIIYAAAIEKMVDDCTSFEAVHIGHSACHFLMDTHAPNPKCH